MKRILMLEEGWKRFITYAWTIGINRYIQENNKDFVLYQMQSWGNWSKNKDFNSGEYAIFDLADLSKYDGIIIDFTNFTNKDRLNNLISQISASGKPVVSVGSESHGFHYVGADGYWATMEILLSRRALLLQSLFLLIVKGLAGRILQNRFLTPLFVKIPAGSITGII